MNKSKKTIKALMRAVKKLDAAQEAGPIARRNARRQALGLVVRLRHALDAEYPAERRSGRGVDWSKYVNTVGEVNKYFPTRSRNKHSMVKREYADFNQEVWKRLPAGHREVVLEAANRGKSMAYARALLELHNIFYSKDERPAWNRAVRRIKVDTRYRDAVLAAAVVSHDAVRAVVFPPEGA